MSDEILGMLRDIRNTQLYQATEMGEVKGALIALAGPEGRVKKLEDATTRQWWYSSCISPILLLLYAGARKLGINI